MNSSASATEAGDGKHRDYNPPYNQGERIVEELQIDRTLSRVDKPEAHPPKYTQDGCARGLSTPRYILHTSNFSVDSILNITKTLVDRPDSQ